MSWILGRFGGNKSPGDSAPAGPDSPSSTPPESGGSGSGSSSSDKEVRTSYSL